MKAVILAGGKGTRGRPYTDYFPKAMIPVDGVPLVQRIVEYVGSHRMITEMIIVADFAGLGGQIKNHLAGHRFRRRLTFVQDGQRGTAADLLCARSHLAGSDKFLLWFVDNLCALDILSMKKHFERTKSIAAVATRNRRKEETGFAAVEGSRIVKFMEKPTLDLRMPECLGIYMLDSCILDNIAKSKKNANLSYDILEGLAKTAHVSAYDIGDIQWLDVESPTILERNQKILCRIIQQMGQ